MTAALAEVFGLKGFDAEFSDFGHKIREAQGSTLSAQECASLLELLLEVFVHDKAYF